MTVIQVDGSIVNTDNGLTIDCNRVVVIPFSKGVVINILTKPYAPNKSYTLIESAEGNVILDSSGREVDPLSLPPLAPAG